MPSISIDISVNGTDSCGEPVRTNIFGVNAERTAHGDWSYTFDRRFYYSAWGEVEVAEEPTPMGFMPYDELRAIAAGVSSHPLRAAIHAYLTRMGQPIAL